MFSDTSLKRVLLAVLATFVSACTSSNCEAPTETPTIDQIAGAYLPDSETAEKLQQMGFVGFPMIVVEEDFHTTIVEMPVIWRQWGRHKSTTENESAEGFFRVANDRVPQQVYIELSSIDGKSTNTTAAGFQICRAGSGYKIEIPYLGWNQGEFLVFRRNET